MRELAGGEMPGNFSLYLCLSLELNRRRSSVLSKRSNQVAM